MVLISLPLASWAQNTGKKPVLIRADASDEQEPAVILPDPDKAREHLEIGDFYFKRENYKAADDRYRDAIRYLPSWAEPYQKLTRSLQRQGAFEEAAKTCEQFILANSDSDEVESFRKLVDEFRAKAPSQESSSK